MRRGSASPQSARLSWMNLRNDCLAAAITAAEFRQRAKASVRQGGGGAARLGARSAYRVWASALFGAGAAPRQPSPGGSWARAPRRSPCYPPGPAADRTGSGLDEGRHAASELRLWDLRPAHRHAEGLPEPAPRGGSRGSAYQASWTAGGFRR